VSTDGRRATPQARRALVANEILDKAATIFADQGFAGTGIRDIADAMEMSRPAVYHYFETKESLVQELVAGVTGEILQFIIELRADRHLDHREKAHALVEGLVRRVAARPAHMRLLAASERSLPEPIGSTHAEAKRDALVEVRAMIAEGVADGAFRPVDERLAALAILGMCNWVAWWYRADGDIPVEEIGAALADLVLEGLPRRQSRRLADGSIGAAAALLREDLAHLERLIHAREAAPRRKS